MKYELRVFKKERLVEVMNLKTRKEVNEEIKKLKDKDHGWAFCCKPPEKEAEDGS